jgi:hypothetical protein
MSDYGGCDLEWQEPSFDRRDSPLFAGICAWDDILDSAPQLGLLSEVLSYQKATIEGPQHANYLWATWGVATALLSVSALNVWSVSCACGYQTPRGLVTSVTLAATAWIGFFLPHSRSYLVRGALDIWAILTTALLGKHLADVLWLSPHAPFGFW